MNNRAPDLRVILIGLGLATGCLVMLAGTANALGPPHNASFGIDCEDCHAMHQGGMMGALVPRDREQEALCRSCHNPTGMAAAFSNVALHEPEAGARLIDCGACHDPHGPHETTDPRTGTTAFNLGLVRSNTDKYVSGALGPVIFQLRPDDFSWDSSPYTGICQTCHTATNYHTNDGVDPHHNEAADCTTCHKHEDGFAPSGCTGCHNEAQNLRRQVVEAGGDFEMPSHHVRGSVQDSDCLVCHYVRNHGSQIVKLRDPDQGDALVHEYDAAAPEVLEGFCLGCHDNDGASYLADGLHPFGDGLTPPNVEGLAGSEWINAAHKTEPFSDNGNAPITCMGDGVNTGCHGNAHGSDNEKILSADSGLQTIEQLCFNCHTDGRVQNYAISGSDVADDIEEAFAHSAIHDFGANFTVGANTYSLDCTSCHNPHVVTGQYWEADIHVSPVTLPDLTADPATNPRAMGTTLWGAAAGQKMDDFGGTYRTPKNDLFSGAQLPDYATFCLECHAQPGSAPFGIDWIGRPHGLQSANSPNGYGVCPNWYGCGKAAGWDGDDCISDQITCWPTITRGKGDQLFSRAPYDHDERVAGANFTLSCTDCHEAHGSSVSSMIRSNPNGGTGTEIWNTMCNNCHYYYSDWHAGMSCGTASCHVSNSIHRMSSYSGSGATRSFDRDLVLHYAFEGNLKDSGSWQMDGKWMDDVPGSYVAGQFGSAAVLSGGMNVQVGTENEYWSTDAGRHGTHIYTEMKYNTTLESWVYPTDDANSEHSIFTKHVGHANGGYTFSLRRMGGTYRAAFNLQADDNAGGQGGASGIRGAYSSVAIPLNTWSHVAVTFDTAGADRNASDPTQGRIRIYVNGEDVTTSDPSGDFMQPGAGETSIYAYVENSPWNESICYSSHWCTGEFSVGGFHGWQNEFIGRLDEAKVWNMTQDAAYFAPIDGTVAPLIVSVAIDAPNQLQVSFSEGVVGSGASAELIPSDFSVSCSGRTIQSVVHGAGDSTATLVLSSNLTPGDIASCTVAAASGAVFDDYALAAGTDPVSLSGSLCPTVASFQMGEAACSATAQDDVAYLTGTVSDSCTTLLGDGYFHGDGDGANNNFIDYFDADACMVSATALTIEARIKPTGIGTANYIRRVISKDADGVNYQVSVWRNTGWATYSPPDNVASIAFWIPPVDSHGGNGWKVVLTDYDTCPIVSDHWYRVRVVWNSAKIGGFPGDIFVDDQGTDGLNTGETWSDYVNCTDADQSQVNPVTQLILEGDQIKAGQNNMRIGTNVNNSTRNHFEGLIDWITVETAVDYTGLDDTPNPPQP